MDWLLKNCTHCMPIYNVIRYKHNTAIYSNNAAKLQQAKKCISHFICKYNNTVVSKLKSIV